MGESVFLIAEAGVNHNGSLDIAKKLVEIATRSGADAIKFQTFTADAAISKSAPKADYQNRNLASSESQYEMVKRLELDRNAHEQLMACCRENRIEFLSTPFDLASIDLLNELGLRIFKIPSGEITSLPYLRKIGALGKELILSTGMADLGEIEDALNVLEEAGTPGSRITVLHCNTEYPTPFQDVNLNAMHTIAAAFPGVRIGYSDHTPGIEVPIAAAAMGATVIEKHFTLDRNMEGPDHRASLDPDELKSMVTAIRNIELALGDGIKRPSASEIKNIRIARKSIVAAEDIRKGDVFSEKNITVKRPGTGISPMRWDEVIGQKALNDYLQDDIIDQ